jgi:hypothetical protein
MSNVMDAILDLETSPVPGQTAYAVLDLYGSMETGQMDAEDTAILNQILVEAGTLNLEKFRRVTVTFPSTRYVVSRDENHVYIVQTRRG